MSFRCTIAWKLRVTGLQTLLAFVSNLWLRLESGKGLEIHSPFPNTKDNNSKKKTTAVIKVKTRSP